MINLWLARFYCLHPEYKLRWWENQYTRQQFLTCVMCGELKT